MRKRSQRLAVILFFHIKTSLRRIATDSLQSPIDTHTHTLHDRPSIPYFDLQEMTCYKSRARTKALRNRTLYASRDCLLRVCVKSHGKAFLLWSMKSIHSHYEIVSVNAIYQSIKQKNGSHLYSNSQSKCTLS